LGGLLRDLIVSFTLGQYHFLLPHIYSIQHDLKFAFDTLNGPVLRYLPPHPPHLELGKLLEGAAMQIKPKVGVQIQLPKFIKARSLTDAVRRVGLRKAYMERKYDGGMLASLVSLYGLILTGISQNIARSILISRAQRTASKSFRKADETQLRIDGDYGKPSRKAFV
jgi:hypothetical protein